MTTTDYFRRLNRSAQALKNEAISQADFNASITVLNADARAAGLDKADVPIQLVEPKTETLRLGLVIEEEETDDESSYSYDEKDDETSQDEETE